MATISGALTLTQIESAIQFEEGKSNEFISSGVSGKNNLVDFKKLPLGEFPKELKLTLSTAAAPDGFSKIWQGAMIVSGKTEDVIAWRLA